MPLMRSGEQAGGDPCAARRVWLDAFEVRTREEQRRQRTAQNAWALARVTFFFGAPAVWIIPYVHPVFAISGTLFFLALFAFAVARYRRADRARAFAEQLLTVIDETRRRLGGRVTLIRSHQRPNDAPPGAGLPAALDGGATWPLTAQEIDDLDLYAAPVGVFGLLNRASSAAGARRLRDQLEAPLLDADAIRRRQQTLARLADDPEARLTLLAAGVPLRRRDESFDALVHARRGAAPLALRLAPGVLTVWSVIGAAVTLSAVVLLGTAAWRAGLLALIVLMTINAPLYGRMRRSLRTIREAWIATLAAAQAAQSFAARAPSALPADGELGRLRQALAEMNAPHRLPALCSRVAWADSGGLILQLLNLTVLAEWHIVRRILDCAVPQREAILDGLAALAELDALLGPGCFAWEQPHVCTPQLAADTALTIVDGRHPLIDPEAVVGNDVRLSAAQRLWLITGSNMAGKSTFLRMAGVNVLLAQIGAAAAAREMTLCPLRLITDLRARDNLARGESYYLAEIRQLRRMIVAPAGEAPLLGLIDEPFRGTNSAEHAAAGLAVLEHLLRSPHLFLLATHEQSLTALPDGNGAANVHFAEDLTGAGMVFDYRLRPGPAVTRNAIRLLEREGYPDALIESARRHLAQPDGDDGSN